MCGFEINQPVDIVFAGKTGYKLAFMFRHSADQTIGHPGVQGTGLVGHDIDIVCFHRQSTVARLRIEIKGNISNLGMQNIPPALTQYQKCHSEYSEESLCMVKADDSGSKRDPSLRSG